MIYISVKCSLLSGSKPFVLEPDFALQVKGINNIGSSNFAIPPVIDFRY